MLRMSRFTKIITVALLCVISFSSLVSAETLSQKTLRLARERQEATTAPQQQARNPYIKSAAVPAKTPTAILVATPRLAAAAPAPTTDDKLLNMVPTDCLFCVRINNLDSALAKTDQFLIGLSPMPITMMAKMQLGTMLGDPMLTSINTQGSFSVFGMLSPGQMSPSIGIIAPVASFNEFVSINAAAAEPDTDGISAITTQNGPPMFATALPDNDFMLITPMPRESLLALKEALTHTPLATALDGGEQNEAITQPIWAYINIAQLSDAFGPMLTAQMEMAKQNIPSTMPSLADGTTPAMNPAEIMGIYFDIIEKVMAESQYVSISANPTAENFNLSYTYAAIAGSDIADALTKDSPVKEKFEMAPYLNSPEAINFLAKVDKESYARFNSAMLKFMEGIMPDEATEQMAKWNTMMNDSVDAMGDEQAFSFSYAAGAPPFAMKQVIRIDDMAKYKAVTANSFAMVDELYQSLGLPITFKEVDKNEDYNGVTIETFAINIDAEKLVGGEPEAVKMIDHMYGKDGIAIKTAMTDGLYLVSMGPDADADIRGLIDQAKSSTQPTPTGDIAMAMKLLPDTKNADFIGSINYIRLLSGLSGMIESMPMPQEQAAGAATFLSSFNVDTQSCMAMAGRVDNGKISVDIVMPKQHITEIMAAAMQAQQKMMQQMMQGMEATDDMPMEDFGEMEMDFESPSEEDAVEITIIGIGDEAAKNAITDKLKDLTDERSGHSMSWYEMNGKLIITLSPVKDVQAFADKIDFGTVDNIDGRNVTVTVE